MDKRLNLAALDQALDQAGFSSADLARELSVSRESVSKWRKGRSLPRPDKLLKLALLLRLKFDDLVLREPPECEPVVAFRKKGSAKTTARHIAHAREMGMLLRPLVPYLPFDEFVRPATLKSPSSDYDYLQRLAAQIRHEAGIGITDQLDFRHLIKRFSDTQTVLIPVLWGKKERHENALHLLLPDSMTTWVYLNLDVEVHDFKFWMAHELGHVLATELRENEGEDFADAFAGALLFPVPLAKEAYHRVHRLNNKGTQVNRIREIAENHLISPISVYYEINKYARHNKLPVVDLEPGIYGAAKNLSKGYYSVSESLFGTGEAVVRDYIAFAGELDSPFFNVLGDYLRDTGKGAGFVQAVLDVPLLDAREIHAELA